ncbi:RagB/SusD family nutrient uptake outer membrane protein [Parasegetibacter sp. NRK P23]|uniref:RagB/SusD family nutrient uptake outer membrane protein n=1 Tax=Parasegetibacter sp. NRK P23 TaxID=2942999 RepID=UPI002043F0A7|nr:RagB/SusD family nutrient uptake outer membrane protein [Parasegetibacter sp. NRK P23]MCM5527808.1 RagB/SusD family nutrient uptake outer membrane protein [Parasegetibacter sp. NRK P23]
MKPISFLYIMLVAALLGSMTSCKKFLERPPSGKLDEDSVIVSSEGIELMLNSALKSMASEQLYGGRMVVLNELVADQLDATLLTGDYGEIYGRRTSIFGDYKNNFYVDNYHVITQANRALEKMDVADAADTTRFIGMAKFIRAVAHFELVRLFAQPYGNTTDNSHPGIPLRTSTGLASLPRATVGQVYAQIVADLIDAEAKLPEVVGGVPGKAAARAFLAKVYFQMNNFGEAYRMANLVLTASSASTYQFNTSASEFTTRYSLNGTKEAIYKLVNTTNIFEPGAHLRGQFRSDGGRVPVLHFTDDLYARFQNTGDQRAVWFNTTFNEGLNSFTKYNLDRFEVPVITVTEMKIIRAESAAETNANLSVAVTDINDIMTRAYGNTSRNLPSNAAAADIINATRAQYLLEFVGEGRRLQEIKRIGARNKTNIDRRGATWNCPGMVLQFPQGEMAANVNFQRNPEGGCN